ERKYLLVAKPFFIAVASRNYAAAFATLQSCQGADVAQPVYAGSAGRRFPAKRILSDDQRNGGAIRLFGAVCRGGAWRTTRAEDAERVFDRSRRFESAKQGAIRGDGFDVCYWRNARLDSRRHPTRELAGSNPHGAVTAGTCKCRPEAGHHGGRIEEGPGF